MKLIVVSDIFGKTASLNQFTAQLSSVYSDVIVIDPYNGQRINFKNEDDAYQHFQQSCGIEELSKRLENEVIKSKEITDIIGFSVGGTAAWEFSGTVVSASVRSAVSFYSSRIREKTNISPNYPTSLVFPVVEKGFDLEPIIKAVENKLNVEVVRTNFLHGFMNRESQNFSETGYKYFSEWLIEKAAEQTN